MADCLPGASSPFDLKERGAKPLLMKVRSLVFSSGQDPGYLFFFLENVYRAHGIYITNDVTMYFTGVVQASCNQAIALCTDSLP